MRARRRELGAGGGEAARASCQVSKVRQELPQRQLELAHVNPTPFSPNPFHDSPETRSPYPFTTPKPVLRMLFRPVYDQFRGLEIRLVLVVHLPFAVCAVCGAYFLNEFDTGLGVRVCNVFGAYFLY